MDENMGPIIIGIIIGAVVLAVILYNIARFMRGSIKLLLPLRAFSGGTEIVGSFDLHTKKRIEGNRLIVSLIGTRVTKTHRDGKTESRTVEIYRDEVLVEEGREYAAGTKEKYDFKLSTPSSESNDFLQSTVGKGLSTALKLLSNQSTKLQWKLEARLDAKGMDLVDSESISINL
jgi:hypothetical protein